MKQTPTSRLELNGLFGWPSKLLDASTLFPWHGKNLPLLAIIDSGVEESNPYIPHDRIHQIILDQPSRFSKKVHGTKVAGLILSRGDGISEPSGVLRDTDLLSIQAGTDEGMSIHQLASAIDLAVRQHAKVINISLGMSHSDPELEAAVHRAISNHVVIVAAAGNEGKTFDDYPAAYSDVIAVSMLNKTGNLENQSNFNSAHNVAAPGDDLLTTGISTNPDGPKAWFSGTSAATPLVSAICDILLANHPDRDAKDIQSILFSTSRLKNQDGKTVRIIDFRSALKKCYQ